MVTFVTSVTVTTIGSRSNLVPDTVPKSCRTQELCYSNYVTPHPWHFIAEAILDIVYVLAYDSAQLGLDALRRPKLVLAYA